MIFSNIYILNGLSKLYIWASPAKSFSTNPLHRPLVGSSEGSHSKSISLETWRSIETLKRLRYLIFTFASLSLKFRYLYFLWARNLAHYLGGRCLVCFEIVLSPTDKEFKNMKVYLFIILRIILLDALLKRQSIFINILFVWLRFNSFGS